MKEAILLSGGIDSICLAFHLKPRIAYTIDYGQTCAKREIIVSKQISKILGIEHQIISVDCSSLGSGELANETASPYAPSKEWWPFRNQLLITLALMKAIKDGVSEIYLGSVKSDSFHKDGTKEFYRLINELSRFQEGSIKIMCNTLNYNTHELVKMYNVPSNLILMAHSCHVSNIACGQCSGCLKQLKVKQELQID